MKRIVITSAALFLVFLAGVLPAHAQATRTWVSGVGDDVNPCSRTAPCKTFAGAISKTAAGGEINVIDSGGFGAVTITKSITIDGAGAHASILASGTNGIVITNAVPTTNVIVTLRNLSINGAGAGSIKNGLNGIRVLIPGAVYIENSVIFGFTQNAIDLNAGSFVSVKNTVIRNSTNGVNAHFAGSAALLDRSSVEGTTAAVRAEGLNTSVTVSETTFVNNASAFTEVSSGQVFSFGNNRIVGAVGAAATLLPLQ